MKIFLLIDDHYVVRAGIKGVLAGLYTACEVHEAESADGAVEHLKKHSYDLVLMDVHIPNSNMLGLMEHINAQYAATKVLMFSMSAENIYAKRFLKAGAMGFLAKDAPHEEITKALNLVLNNRRYISSTLADMLASEAIGDAPSNPFSKLSAREFEIVSLLLSGHTLNEMAKTLYLQVSTVGTHKARAFEKLGVETILQLKELASAYGL